MEKSVGARHILPWPCYSIYPMTSTTLNMPVSHHLPHPSDPDSCTAGPTCLHCPTGFWAELISLSVVLPEIEQHLNETQHYIRDKSLQLRGGVEVRSVVARKLGLFNMGISKHKRQVQCLVIAGFWLVLTRTSNM